MITIRKEFFDKNVAKKIGRWLKSNSILINCLVLYVIGLTYLSSNAYANKLGGTKNSECQITKCEVKWGYPDY